MAVMPEKMGAATGAGVHFGVRERGERIFQRSNEARSKRIWYSNKIFIRTVFYCCFDFDNNNGAGSPLL